MPGYVGYLDSLGTYYQRTLLHLSVYGHDLFSSYEEIYKSDMDIQENLGP